MRMSPSLWEVFLGLFSGGEGSEDESAEGRDGRRFVPSPLDLSVRIGHGGSDSQRVRELARINERADELDEERRDN